MKYFIAVAFVWIGCTIAWILLGSTLVYRSGSMSGALETEVSKLWGPPLEQRPPRAMYLQPKKVKEKVTTYDLHGKPVETEIEKEVEEQLFLPLTASTIQANLELEHRQKGLLWFPTYTVGFQADYEFHNDTDRPRKIDVLFPLGDSRIDAARGVGEGNVVYDGFAVTRVNGDKESFDVNQGSARWTTTLEPGERRAWKVRYRSRGRTEWRYQMTDGTGRVERFALDLGANFSNVNFPAGSLSPTRHTPVGTGWRGEWRFDSLISSSPIGIELPQKLNPGPLASQMTFFAPVGLLFFFFVVAVLSAGRKQPIHPMHYFFLGCSFFAFHLLFAYLVDHLQVWPSFSIAATVAFVLVVSYVRLFRGFATALAVFGVPQLVYLVLFSSTFFWQGYTGLAIAVLAVLTLFIIMQITGRVRWEEAFAPKLPPPQSFAPGAR